MSNRNRNSFFTCILLLVIFFSCKEIPVKYEYKQTIVKAKTIGLRDGNTIYSIAFTDGKSENVSFGEYSKYEIGDTICWEREEGWIWYIINCN